MAIRGAFAAGFLGGLDKSLTEGINERKKRMEELIDNSMDTAKRIAPKYAQTKAELSGMNRIGDAFKRDFNISDEEFLALVQSTDVNALYKSVYAENDKRQNTLGVGISKADIMSGINVPEGFVMPKGETRDTMLQKMFNLRTEALAEEDDPKSEGAQNRSFGKALMRFMVVDPKMSAEERLNNLKVMGVDVNTLMAYEASGGVKRDVIPGVERTSEYSLTPLDYDDNDAKSTQVGAYRAMTLRATGADFTSEAQIADYTSRNTKDADVIKRNAYDASMSVAELERQIIRTNMNNTAISGRYGRQDIITKITGSVDTTAEFQTLTNSIKTGYAIEVINSAIKEGRELTEDDIDAIITGAKKEEQPVGAGGAEPSVPTVIKDDPELISMYEGLNPKVRAALAASLSATENPDVARMLVEKAAAGGDTTVVEKPMGVKAEETIKDATAKAGEVLKDEAKTVEQKAEEMLDILVKEANLIMPTNRDELNYFVSDISSVDLDIPQDVLKAIMAKAREGIKG